MNSFIMWMTWLGTSLGAAIILGTIGRAAIRRAGDQTVHPAELVLPGLGAAVLIAIPRIARWVYDTTPEQALPDLPWGSIAAVVGGVLAVLAVVAAVAAGATAVKRGRKRKKAELNRRRAVEARHDAVREAYGAYESDFAAVLDRPALADVTVPTTERLIHALTEAADARQADRSTSDSAAAYQRAVTALEIAWKAADEHARRIGVEHLAVAEQKAITQARKLLRSALHDGGSDHERRLAYQHAMRLIDGAISVPRQAAAALEHISRPSLPNSPTAPPTTARGRQ